MSIHELRINIQATNPATYIPTYLGEDAEFIQHRVLAYQKPQHTNLIAVEEG